MCCSDEEFAAGIAKELQLEEEQLAVDKLTYVDTPPGFILRMPPCNRMMDDVF